MQELTKKLRSGSAAPSLFAVVQLLGAECHRNILTQQEKCAGAILADPTWGPRIRELQHSEEKEKMTQRLVRREVGTLRALCSNVAFKSRVDRAVMPVIMCEVAAAVRDQFSDALLRCVKSNKTKNLRDILGSAGKTDPQVRHPVELKVGPIKGVHRIGVKVNEYASEKGEEAWPHSQFVTVRFRHTQPLNIIDLS